MFSLRTDNEKYPAALLINDTRKVEVTIDATDKNVPYEIKGSPASQAIIEFDKNIDKEAQIISQLRQEADSLMKSKANDTIIRFKYTEYNTALQNIKNYTLDQLDKSNSPVLSLYIIGGYQRMAGNLGLKGFTETELTDLINKAAVKFPNHTALNNIKDKLKPRKAPDFTLPDTSGHAVSLSSFK